MSYDPNQPGWAPTPQPAPNAGYQPPEGSNPGNMPPQAPYPGYAGQTYAGQPVNYGAYPGPMAPSTSGWAIASLVSSIAGYVGFALIGGILGAIFGHIALNEINKSPQPMEGRGLAMAGLILGYINIGLSLCAVAGFLALVFGVLGNIQ